MANAAEEPVYFWTPEQEDGYLGQWYPSRFVATADDGTERTYQNAEQYMMHQKGLLFAPNSPITASILETPNLSPRTIKQLGRQVPNFDDSVWHEHRYKIVVRGNYLKFTQNLDLKELLLKTGDRELVEASPRDKIWGVGFGKENAGARRADWGLNLLGKALMEVRGKIREESVEE